MSDKICKMCQSPISSSRKKTGISCDGFCDTHYHLSCLDLPQDILKWNSHTGCFWFCSSCSTIKNNGDLYAKFVSDHIQDAIKKMEDEFLSMKSRLLASITSLKSDQSLESIKPTFSQVTKKNKTAVVIKPKNESQNVSVTKSEVLQGINPMESNVPITRVKHIDKGGLLISCDTDEDNLKLKKMVDDKLANNYKINEIRNPRPRIKIVGINEHFEKEEIEKLLKSQNSAKIKQGAECKIVRLWQTKRRNDVYQAIIELDVDSYSNIMCSDHRFLMVGLDSCQVFDGVDLKRCFKCCGFNHYFSNCASKLCCPRCSEGHELKDCKSESVKCINCINYKKLKINSNINVDTNHTVWDTGCTVYKQKLNSLKNAIFGKQ